MLKKDYSNTKKVCKVTFSLPTTAVQDGAEVRVLGDFNAWAWQSGLVMKAGKTEYTASIELALGANYEFRYAINNERWENDWAADAYVPSPFDGITNSLVSVSAVVDGELTGKADGGKKVKATGAPKVEKPAAAAKEEAPKAPAKAKAPAKTTTTVAKTTKAPAKSKAKETPKK
ncbi:isoamylase early set domain-containing protein [Haliscomenobacter sp.]|uniref:isoamylase early set domain-containing protein n=1 Tax=Haliscomenobacter sp. TaxID=2717303 RepID=UPI0035935BC6